MVEMSTDLCNECLFDRSLLHNLDAEVLRPLQRGQGQQNAHFHAERLAVQRVRHRVTHLAAVVKNAQTHFLPLQVALQTSLRPKIGPNIFTFELFYIHF